MDWIQVLAIIMVNILVGFWLKLDFFEYSIKSEYGKEMYLQGYQEGIRTGIQLTNHLWGVDGNPEL